MAVTRVRYTQEEVAILLEELQKSPTNLLKGCERAAKKINKLYRSNRNAKSCYSYYIRNLAKNTEVFTLKTEHTTVTNVKNTPVKKQINFKSQLLHSLIDELTPTERFELSKKLISSL